MKPRREAFDGSRQACRQGYLRVKIGDALRSRNVGTAMFGIVSRERAMRGPYVLKMRLMRVSMPAAASTIERRLRSSLAFVMTGARFNGGDVAPVAFSLRMHETVWYTSQVDA